MLEGLRKAQAVLGRLAGGAARVYRLADGWLMDLRARMTPGQRWTAALASLIAITVLLFGVPARVVVPDAAAQAPAPPVALAPPSAPESEPVPGPAPAPLPALPPPVELPPPPELGAELPEIVALVREGNGELPGRNDAAIAEAFLAGGGFEAETVTFEPGDEDLCKQLAGAGDVLVASRGLPRSLRACLVERGLVLVAHDPMGSAEQVAGGVVSTHRGVGPNLADLGRWGVTAGTLDGPVGVVAPVEFRPEVADAVDELRVLGIDVRGVAYLGSGREGDQDLATEVLRFQGSGIDTVVLAASVEQQRRWVALHTLLQPGTRYVVADGIDSIVDETYPPTFEGALAYTTIRTPWYEREHGETAEQGTCRRRWERAAPPGPVSARELSLAFMWCQHVRLIDFALQRMQRQDSSFGEALRAQRFDSPLTSDLRVLPGDGYGPAQDAVLSWGGVCRCWSETRPYRDRPAR